MYNKSKILIYSTVIKLTVDAAREKTRAAVEETIWWELGAGVKGMSKKSTNGYNACSADMNVDYRYARLGEMSSKASSIKMRGV